MDTVSQTTFGPIIWCQINVDPTMAAAPSSADISDVASIPPMAGIGVDVALSTEDLFTFVKTLEKTAKKGNSSARPGPLAVPTNTPLGKLMYCIDMFIFTFVTLAACFAVSVKFFYCCGSLLYVEGLLCFVVCCTQLPLLLCTRQ